MKLENLPPQNLSGDLQIRKNQLEQVIQMKSEAVKNAPPGKLYVSKSNGIYQFYLPDTKKHAQKNKAEKLDQKESQKKKKTAKYVRMSEKETIRTLCQKEYDQTELEKLESEYEYIGKLISLYDSKETLNPGKMQYVIPVTLPNDEYAAVWRKTAFACKKKLPEDVLYETSFGLKVRSKSEVMIAEMLKNSRIPFRYEMQIDLAGYKVYPDFYCLNVRTRQEFIWEHFGMMDNEEYARNAIEKMNTYDSAGYKLGKNFIATFETSKTPLNTKKILQVIEDNLI